MKRVKSFAKIRRNYTKLSGIDQDYRLGGIGERIEDCASVPRIDQERQQTGNKSEPKVSTVKELVTLSTWMRDTIDNPKTKDKDRQELLSHIGELARALGEATKSGRKKIVQTRAKRQERNNSVVIK